MRMTKAEAGRLGWLKARAKFDDERQRKIDAAVDKFKLMNLHCEMCGVELPYEQRKNRFCSKRCSGRRQRPRPAIEDGRMCRGCKTNPPKWDHKYLAFCQACIDAKLIYQRVTVETAVTDRARRRLLLKVRPHRCDICGTVEWMGQPVPLEMDHIDGNSDHNGDSNLRLLCPNCHAQTPTHKGRNRGKGGRRQRQKNERRALGLSY